MENKVRFKLHKVKKHWITIAASSLAIGASLIGLGQVGADEVKPETTAVNSPENVVSDSNLETSASLITRTEVAPTSTVVENTSSEAVSTDTTSTNVASQPLSLIHICKSYFYDPDNGALVTNRLVTFKAGRFIPEENYAKEVRFDFAPYANYDNNEHPELERYYLGADGLPVTGWQTINGNKYFFQDDGNMVVHRFFNNYYFYNDGTIARNKRLNIPTHYITREFPNIYEFDNDGVGKFISRCV